ncbi:hypothetical protein [Neptunicella sp. SCSIO 80796]|uniref:hypothetical protein n=1 Tax=Neptunicella plasticusilytica TaxID=3117012 RepID=UPI003A4E07DB
MAYKRSKRLKQVRWPVSVFEARDGGKTEEFEIFLIFEQLGQKEMSARCARQTKAQFIQGVTSDWEGMLDECDSPIPFDKALFADCLDDANFVQASFDAYQNMVLGIAAKN